MSGVTFHCDFGTLCVPLSECIRNSLRKFKIIEMDLGYKKLAINTNRSFYSKGKIKCRSALGYHSGGSRPYCIPELDVSTIHVYLFLQHAMQICPTWMTSWVHFVKK